MRIPLTLTLLLLLGACGDRDGPAVGPAGPSAEGPRTETQRADAVAPPAEDGLPADTPPPEDGLPPDAGPGDEAAGGRVPGSGLWCGTPGVGDAFGAPRPLGPYSGNDIVSGHASAFPGRERHQTRLARRAAPRAADEAIDAALRWLAAHQSPHGGWEAAGFGAWCDGKPVAEDARPSLGAGSALRDVGVSGLALSAFLGAGYTNRGKHRYAKTISRGLRYLVNVQDPEGCFGPRTHEEYVLDHATAALAMVEAFGMTGSVIFKRSAQRALDFIALARTPYGAWGPGIKAEAADARITGCMLQPVVAAAWIDRRLAREGRAGPLAIDEGVFDGLRAWLGEDGDAAGDGTPTGTAIRMLARLAVGEQPRESAALASGARRCAGHLPRWGPEGAAADLVYWSFATHALHQVGGAPWRSWRAAMAEAMVASQRRDTDACGYAGSWDPHGPGTADGGRVFATAVAALCLEVFYRYPRGYPGAP